ncbi:uncharacterized protein LOC118353363 isoform X2 [Canis lupus dingo]|nr:uncharacterized protein LOC118353363 isoform X2 [Canis lupus dingo]
MRLLGETLGLCKHQDSGSRASPPGLCKHQDPGSQASPPPQVCKHQDPGSWASPPPTLQAPGPGLPGKPHPKSASTRARALWRAPLNLCKHQDPGSRASPPPPSLQAPELRLSASPPAPRLRKHQERLRDSNKSPTFRSRRPPGSPGLSPRPSRRPLAVAGPDRGGLLGAPRHQPTSSELRGAGGQPGSFLESSPPPPPPALCDAPSP